MTLQAALSTAIELLRTMGLPDHLKAAKVLEKKHERLRLKQETKAANVEDFSERELTMNAEAIREVFVGEVCACGKKKAARTAFGFDCCWKLLSPKIRKATHTHSFGAGFEQVYEAGCNELAKLRNPPAELEY